MFVCDETVEYALCSEKENGLPFVLLFGALKSLSWTTNSYHDCMQSGFTNVIYQRIVLFLFRRLIDPLALECDIRDVHRYIF